MMQPYGFDYAFTDAVIQHGKAKAKLLVFGDADDNVKYAQGVYCQLKDVGHLIKYVYSKRSKVISKLGHVVIAEEEYRRKYDGLPPFGAMEKSSFVDKWKRDHESEITKQLGYKTGPQYQFLTGILFATSTSKITVPLLQNVRLNMFHYCMFYYFSYYDTFLSYAITIAGGSSRRRSHPVRKIYSVLGIRIYGECEHVSNCFRHLVWRRDH